MSGEQSISHEPTTYITIFFHNSQLPPKQVVDKIVSLDLFILFTYESDGLIDTMINHVSSIGSGKL